MELERNQYKEYINENHLDEYLIALRNASDGSFKREDSKKGDENVMDDESAVNLIKSMVFNNTALTDGE